MNRSSFEDHSLALESLREERTRQDAKLAFAHEALAALGSSVVSVPRAALLAIDAACLVRVSSLGSHAIRG